MLGCLSLHMNIHTALSSSSIDHVIQNVEYPRILLMLVYCNCPSHGMSTDKGTIHVNVLFLNANDTTHQEMTARSNLDKIVYFRP